MERIDIPSDGISAKDLERVANLLLDGKVMIYPTETVFGIGAEISQEHAINRIFTIKGRDERKPLSIAVAKSQIHKYAHVSSNASILIDALLPGPLTLVLHKKSSVPDYITGGSKKVGIRVPDHSFVQALVNWLETAVVSTSANRSSMPPAVDIDSLDPEIASKVDLLITSHEVMSGQPSTVVDASGSRVQLLREGSIPFSLIRKVLKNPELL